MDTTSLKEYIFNNNKVEFVLEKIGCKSIKYHSSKNFYSAANYNGDNTGAVNVYNTKHLLIHNWTRESEFDDVSDIISLVQYNKKCSFVDAVKYLHNILGLELTPYKKEEKKEKLDPLAIFKNAISRYRSIVDVSEIQTISEEAINDLSFLGTEIICRLPAFRLGYLEGFLYRNESVCPSAFELLFESSY